MFWLQVTLEPNEPMVDQPSPPTSAEMPAGRAPVSNAHGYPRPQLHRDGWTSLNGEWDFAFDEPASITTPRNVEWTHKITVPFSPETSASGLNATGYFRAVWYRREFNKPTLAPGERLLLHFGAVDYFAEVWVNGIKVCSHRGG